MTTQPPGQPASYAWEATDESVAERYGVPVGEVERFDLNTPGLTPAWVRELLASGPFQAPLHDYPPGDYGVLGATAAGTYGVETGEVVVAAGADEALDICLKAFVPPDGRVVVAPPTYSFYRVLIEQRPARVVSVPRLGPTEGYRLDLAALRTVARDVDLIFLCDPNNPTGLPDPDGGIEELLRSIVDDAATAGRRPPVVVIDEAYAEFVGRSRIPLIRTYENLIVIRTVSKAYSLASFRVGFAVLGPSLGDRLKLFRAPGSISTVSATVATEGLRRPDVLRATVGAAIAERERFSGLLREAGWSVGPSVTNFLLVDFGTPTRAGEIAEALLRHGLVPRTFGAGNPLAGHLRLTVRSVAADDRLVAVAHAAGRPGR